MRVKAHHRPLRCTWWVAFSAWVGAFNGGITLAKIVFGHPLWLEFPFLTFCAFFALLWPLIASERESFNIAEVFR